jgi:hypothetical protein
MRELQWYNNEEAIIIIEVQCDFAGNFKISFNNILFKNQI